MKKLIFIVLDGGAEPPSRRVWGRSAFDAANKPYLDSLAKRGINGTIKGLPIPPESDEAVLSLLGYDVFKVYSGRGPLEVIGGGIPFRDGDLAVRCNFGTIEDGQIVDVRSGSISTAEARKLEEALNSFITLKDATFTFRATASHRGVLVIRSKKKLSSKITNTHPGYALRYFEPVWQRGETNVGIPVSEALPEPDMSFQPSVPLDQTKEAKLAADLVNEFIRSSRIVLSKHPVNMERMAKGLKPANIILTRDAGTTGPRLYKFNKVYEMKWLCMADMPVERGIAISAGMEVLPLPEPTTDTRADMTTRAISLLKNLHLYDAIYVHLKGPDIFSHKGDLYGKTKVIEEIDEFFFGPLLANIDMNNTVVVVTCDHATSSETRTHTADPVPVTVSGAGLIPDGTTSFSEDTCSRGKLGELPALRLMPWLVRLVKD
jgi:2,3-bisphosphoglycerate-independent phosphoglycerate mutase